MKQKYICLSLTMLLCSQNYVFADTCAPDMSSYTACVKSMDSCTAIATLDEDNGKLKRSVAENYRQIFNNFKTLDWGMTHYSTKTDCGINIMTGCRILQNSNPPSKNLLTTITLTINQLAADLNDLKKPRYADYYGVDCTYPATSQSACDDQKQPAPFIGDMTCVPAQH